MRIENVELMSTGNPDGRQSLGDGFTQDDLQSIASSFEALSLKGRVPLKFGHNDEQPMLDGQPALGWVDRVWVEGNKLLADLTDLPKVVYEAIKKGLYKFISVELLRDVQAGTRKIPWVLDAVALLGADQPAFGNLRDLQSLTLNRSTLKFSERVSFSRNKFEVQTMNKVESLQAEIINMKFNHAIQSGRIQPNQRESFFRRYGRLSVEEQMTEVDSWINSAPQSPKSNAGRPATFHVDEGDGNNWTGDPTAEVSRRMHAVQDEHVRLGRDISLLDSLKVVMRDPTNKDLMAAYWARESR